MSENFRGDFFDSHSTVPSHHAGKYRTEDKLKGSKYTNSIQLRTTQKYSEKNCV